MTFARPAAWEGLRIIDSDVRVDLPPWAELLEHLERHWRDYVVESGLGRLTSTMRPADASLVLHHVDSTQDALERLRTGVLDPLGTTKAVVTVPNALDEIHNDDAAAAFATAVNRWQAERVLASDHRLRGSIVVGLRNPELAAAEIERWAGDNRFVQVQVHARAPEPLGRRSWWPLHRAAAAHGLAVAVLPDGVSGLPTTAVGWPSTYLEDYVGLAQTFASQLHSLVSEGVFNACPELTVILVEAGWTWLPSLLWRFDKNWKGLRREVPWVSEPPSAVIRRHVRFTMQPLDADPQSAADVLDQLGEDALVMFSTAFPTRLTDDVAAAVPTVDPQRLATLLGGTAQEVYRA